MSRRYLSFSLIALFLLTVSANHKQTDSLSLKSTSLTDEPRTVMILPVDYFYFTWDEWGLVNDYLQEKLITDLSSAFPEKFRFYTESSINEQAINPDLVVRLDFCDISIGKPKTITEDYGRGASVSSTNSSSVPPNSLYTSNTSSVGITTTIIESNATLNSIIYYWATDDTILTQGFSGTYKWEEQSASFRSRNEANREMGLTNDIVRRNTNTIITPLQSELAKKLMDICYKKAFKKIKAELELNNK